MSYLDIINSVNNGLASAAEAVGGGSKKTYLVTKTKAGGDPFTPPTVSNSYTELVNAVWVSVDNSLIDGTNILQGDLMLTSSANVGISVGDFVTTGSSGVYGREYRVVSVNDVSPMNETLVYKSVLRAQ